MISRLRNLSLVYQLALAVAFITTLVFTGLVTFTSTQTSQSKITSVEHELDREVKLMATMLEFFHQSLMTQTNKLSDIFFGMFAEGSFEVDADKLTQVGKYQVPTLIFNGEAINNNFAKPDTFTAMTGGSATIFLRVGDDFLRVSTSLKKQDGSRAFGTMLGTNHPGYQTLINGKIYAGPAKLFGRNYMTKYVPFKDTSGKVIGILYIGFNYTARLEALKQDLGKVAYGDTGYAYAIAAKPGPTQGELVMHPTLEGKNLLAMKDAAGQTIFTKLLDGDSGTLNYYWKTGNGEPKAKIVAYHRVKGWDWVIAAGSYTSEFTKDNVHLRELLIGVAVISALVIIALIFLVLRRQLQPLARLGRRVEQLGAGDLTDYQTITDRNADAQTRNEVYQLERQVQNMAGSLHDLISGVDTSMQSLVSVSQRVSQVAGQTGEGVKSQQAETDQVATAINELAATVQEVAQSAASAAEETQAADQKAAHGNTVVRSVIDSIQSLASEVEQSTGVIVRVERESEDIGSVLEVIRGIAEQTNLLALNAAIEAARAGEQGRGFAVVADEVRNLAQKTQESTTEINDMIQRLQSSAKEAVAAMEAGRSKAQDSVKLAGEAGGNLTEIANSTSAITGVTVQIAAAAEEQTAVAEEINQSVIRIREIANSTARGSDDMDGATRELQQVAAQLQNAVARFRT